jgi:type I restriction enzyme R subunit
LFPPDVIAWVQATQPGAWETLAKNHGATAEAVLLDRIRKQRASLRRNVRRMLAKYG